MTNTQNALALNESPFTFENHPVRVVMRDGEPWFVAADVCKALQLSNPSESLKASDADERNTLSSTEGIHTGPGNPSVNIISESGMYTLVLRCRDAVKAGTVPYRFRKWVTSEVLPSIRKTGSYCRSIDPAELLLKGHCDPIPSPDPVPLPDEVEQALQRRAWELTREAHDLIDRHLRMRVTAHSFRSNAIHSEAALAALNCGTLGDALTHTHRIAAEALLSEARYCIRLSGQFFEKLQDRLRQHGLTPLS